MVKWKSVFFIVALPLVAGLGGCVKDTAYAPSTAPRYMTVKRSDLFKYGPLQPGPADQIPAYTIVRITTLEKGGFSQILLANGSSGYMATEDLKLAPPVGKSVSESRLFPEDDYAKIAAANQPHIDFSVPVDVLPTTKSSGTSTNSAH